MRRCPLAIKTRSKALSQGSEKRLTTTVHQCRGGPFLPVSQVPNGFKGRDFRFSNQWGTCVVRDSFLTQTHYNIIDAIFDNSKLTKSAPDGQILVAFSPYEVLAAIGHKHKTHHNWLDERLEDLRKVRVNIEINGLKITGGIVRKHAKSLLDNEDAQRRGGFAETAKYWYVVFESEYSRFFLHDVKVHYQALLTEIFRLKHGVTQALVRFCLSHDQVNMALDDVLLAIGAFAKIRPENEDNPEEITIATPLRTQQRIRKSVKDEVEVLKRDFGIGIRQMADGQEGVFYKKHPKVWFESQKKPLISGHCAIRAQKNEIGEGRAMV